MLAPVSLTFLLKYGCVGCSIFSQICSILPSFGQEGSIGVKVGKGGSRVAKGVTRGKMRDRRSWERDWVDI